MSASLPSPAPCIDIHLPSGLLLRNAAAMLVAKFGQWPWDRFDGIQVADPHIITDDDVDLAFRGVRARTKVKRCVFMAQIQEHGEQIAEFLRALPVGVGIEEEALDLGALRAPIVGLFDCLTAVKGAKLANATKLTYRHRPRLLPVLDSALDNYYWYSTSIRDEARFLRMRTMTWGEYAFALLELFREDLRAVTAEVDRVRAAVSGQPFADASRARILESLIWYYYLGR